MTSVNLSWWFYLITYEQGIISKFHHSSLYPLLEVIQTLVISFRFHSAVTFWDHYHSMSKVEHQFHRITSELNMIRSTIVKRNTIDLERVDTLYDHYYKLFDILSKESHEQKQHYEVSVALNSCLAMKLKQRLDNFVSTCRQLYTDGQEERLMLSRSGKRLDAYLTMLTTMVNQSIV